MANPLSLTRFFTDANLQAYFKFDSGADTVDSSPNTNDLTHVNTPTNGAGQFGNAETYLKVSSQHSYKASPSGLGSTGAFTITGWAKLTVASAGFTSMFSQDLLSARGYKLGIQGGGVNPAPQFIVYNSGGILASAISTVDLAVGTWTFVAARYDGSGGCAVWHNATKTTASGTAPRNNTSSSKLGIGCDFTAGSDAAGNFADCAFDDFAFFDRSLSDAEIDDIRTGVLAQIFLRTRNINQALHRSNFY